MQRIFHTIEAYEMIRPGMRVLAAVSGGADSVCLLAALAAFREQMDFSLYVIHVEHGLRGEESLEDARYVEELCRSFSVPFFLESVDAAAEARKRHLSVEEAGRALRYEAFDRIAGQVGADRIAVAHNENDQAETVLWNLVRGSGLQGLGGIRPVRGRIIRPLLFLGRPEIEQILQAQGIAWRTDRTNLTCEYTRNRIRRQLLPQLEQELNPQAIGHIASAAQRLQEVQEYLNVQCEAIAKTCVQRADDGIYLELAGYGQQHALLQKELLKHCISLLRDGAGWKDIGSVHLAALERLCCLPCGKSCVLPGGIRAERVERMTADGKAGQKQPMVRFWLEERRAEKTGTDIPLRPGTEQQVGALRIQSALLDAARVQPDEILQEKKYTKWLSYDTIKSGVCFRRRRAGDYLVVNEQGGRKKLKNYLIDEKIPQKQRDQLWLLADGSHILWVVGWRISEAAKVHKDTEKVLRIHVEEEIQ